MTSRLVDTLQQQVRTATDPEVWARAMCRLAAHDGRQGHVTQANDRIATVRRRFGTAMSPSVGASVMLAEGIILFFQDRQVEAYDRVRRAYSVAVAARIEPVRPICAAWMAHLEFNLQRYDDMAFHLGEALSHAAADDHQARARASLVLADALHFAGDFAQARPWYEKTRLHATAEGDEATLSALLHNVAAFRICNVRIADALGVSDPVESKRAMMEAGSAEAYDHGVGTESLRSLLPLLRGQLLTVEKRFCEAEQVFKAIDQRTLEAKSAPILLADLAWCYSNLGRHADAESSASKAESLIGQTMEPDEAAYVNARLGQVSMCNGRSHRSIELFEASSLAVAKHRDLQIKIGELLRPLAGRD